MVGREEGWEGGGMGGRRKDNGISHGCWKTHEVSKVTVKGHDTVVLKKDVRDCDLYTYKCIYVYLYVWNFLLTFLAFLYSLFSRIIGKRFLKNYLTIGSFVFWPCIGYSPLKIK